ncbi:Bacteriophytochrome [compost metagenome]
MRIGDLGDVRCDRERVTQLFSNLLTNAIVHGAPDTPVQASADVQDNVFLLGVHNQGPPITAEVMAQLFRPFSHASGGTPQRGLGLGLYIANQIALAHGGRMEVVSTAETGTLFSFRLPLA